MSGTVDESGKNRQLSVFICERVKVTACMLITHLSSFLIRLLKIFRYSSTEKYDRYDVFSHFHLGAFGFRHPLFPD